MTTMQICALIIAILFIGLTYWGGYRGGLSDGRAEGHLEGIKEGKAIQSSDDHGTLMDLQLLLDQARENHNKLYTHYKRALAASKLGEPARQTLLDIAEKLRIAAETFSAFRTGKKLERDSLALRDQALAMAVLLDPLASEPVLAEADSSVIQPSGKLIVERAPTEKMCRKDSQKAQQFFRNATSEFDPQNPKASGGDV
ncbi:hypothetical protein PF66_02389 [Pseudomonas asplenii]|uniref:Uncharacterized protein n=1 Tax=Pseudomonas asplenii TaxID=53407 RepID=A0A0N0E4A6_9PSED|nr:hypothetical protein [Pseudomonas fuscovaginae]KPA91051.1 hypothetical protein PF66_02389 [Pseudomonas fuscovaginae]